jgi:hypothetical protein
VVLGVSAHLVPAGTVVRVFTTVTQLEVAWKSLISRFNSVCGMAAVGVRE